MELVRNDVRPSQIITRDALENAAASIAATGGSTNGVLHLLAIAHELGIPFALDDFDPMRLNAPSVGPKANTRGGQAASTGGCRAVVDGNR